MLRNVLLLSIGFALFVYQPLFSQILEPVKWEFKKESAGNNEYLLIIDATIDSNWYLYGVNIPDGGPIPTSFYFDESQWYELSGAITEDIEPEVKFDPFFDMELPLFSNEARFIQKIKANTTGEFTVTGALEFMSCDDERCLPPQEVLFEFVINEGSAHTTDETNDFAGTASRQTSDSRSLWIFFIISFAGGLAGLLTPCVFPMIPMTVSFFMQKEPESRSSVKKAIVFGISIIAVYTLLGLIVSLTTAGAGLANQLTSHWIPNTIFFILFILFAASFFGMFEIVLPGNLATRADKGAEKGGYAGAFFMALTLVIVSLSCVGPIVGALLVEAASSGGIKPVTGMFGFSLAFAIPFTLLAIFPSWTQKLPKSGGWLNSVKVVLGFIILAFSLRFISVIDQTYHIGILTRDLYIAIWIVIFTLLGMYLLGKIKFAHDNDLPALGVPRFFMSIAVFSFVVYLIPGMFGAPLKSISSMLPPQHTHSFDIGSIIRESRPAGNGVTQLCDDPLFGDFLNLPHGLNGYFQLKQGLDCAREQNKPVFLNFTGHACSNCKEMEARVWSDRQVLQLLRDEFIIISLYVDDRTRLPEDQWITSDFDGRIKNTLGTKNLDYQITKFGTNTQPFYVIIDSEENVLTEPGGYNLNIGEFIQFLESGINNFNHPD